MEFKVIEPKEQCEYRVGDAIIFYREATPRERDELLTRFSGAGEDGKVEIDQVGIAYSVKGSHITGWKGITVDGQPAEFSRELLMKIDLGAHTFHLRNKIMQWDETPPAKEDSAENP